MGIPLAIVRSIHWVAQPAGEPNPPNCAILLADAVGGWSLLAEPGLPSTLERSKINVDGFDRSPHDTEVVEGMRPYPETASQRRGGREASR